MELASQRATEIYNTAIIVLARFYKSEGGESVTQTLGVDGKRTTPRSRKTTFGIKSDHVCVTMFEESSDQVVVRIRVYRGREYQVANECVRIELLFEGEKCFYNITNNEWNVISIGNMYGEQRRNEIEKLIDNLVRVALKYTDIAPLIRRKRSCPLQ